MEQSWVVAAFQGNNEVSMWDLETSARQQTLWASSFPPLSQSQVYLSQNRIFIVPYVSCHIIDILFHLFDMLYTIGGNR